MIERFLIAAGAGGLLFLSLAQAAPQLDTSPADSVIPPQFPVNSVPLIHEIRFVGLRRISLAALCLKISSREGQTLDPNKLDTDLRVLARLGWFDEISVESQSLTDATPLADKTPPHLRLIFHLAELPYLTGVEFSGSKLLSRRQIDRLLTETHLTPRLGEPADPVALHRIALAIQSSLGELAHPQARVELHREEFANHTVRGRFEISDGPHVPVERIRFEGQTEFPAKLLRHQMRRIAPGSFFAGLRGKNAFTREAFEYDREHLLAYYQNHGYPEARIGNASISRIEKSSVRWLLWPHRATAARLSLAIPVQSGPRYVFASLSSSPTLLEASGPHTQKFQSILSGESGKPYSAQTIEDLRHAWQATIQSKTDKEISPAYRSLETTRTFNPEKHTVEITFGLSDTPPILVRRVEIQGLHRFSDRFVRRRIPLQEGRPFDDHALETGLARLTRTGYFRPIRKEDIHVQTDEAARTADVTIHLQEIGQQRASFSGSHGQFGSTLGLAYTVFDLFERDELLASQIDAGPESLQLMLGLAKQGFLGSRGSLALSIFNNVLRPRFTGSVKGPFYTSETQGLNAGWAYAVTNTDSLGINYTLSRSNTDYSLPLPANLTGVTASDVRACTSNRSLGLGWTRDSDSQRFTVANSFSGSWLGGSENLLRSSEEYARLVPDPLFNHQNAFTFRTSIGSAGSYRGDMPLYTRLFPSDDEVRGLRTGELGPYAAVSSISSAGNPQFSAIPAGANLFTAANLEYRIPISNGTQAAGFFDLGSGWLLPNWLGTTRPLLLGATNGVLHGSTGIQLQWTVPGIQVPVRGYYAVNVLRLNRFLKLPDGSLFHVRNHLSGFGWALGTLL
jgi:outer membrane protein assembly complex protein YaeT